MDVRSRELQLVRARDTPVNAKDGMYWWAVRPETRPSCLSLVFGRIKPKKKKKRKNCWPGSAALFHVLSASTFATSIRGALVNEWGSSVAVKKSCASGTMVRVGVYVLDPRWLHQENALDTRSQAPTRAVIGRWETAAMT
jgi:hypothetical protein